MPNDTGGPTPGETRNGLQPIDYCPADDFRKGHGSEKANAPIREWLVVAFILLGVALLLAVTVWLVLPRHRHPMGP